MIGRREFITLLNGAAAAWSFAAGAQQMIRRVGMLLPAPAGDAEVQVWVGAFLQGLALAGWNIGSNARIDTRHAGSNTTAHHAALRYLAH